MVESYKQIEITCPTCGSVKIINVPEAIFTQKKFGTIKVQVPAGAICPGHHFIVFIDTKGVIRGYEKIDMSMKVPMEEKEKKPGFITLGTLINKFGLYGLFSLVHAKIFNYPHYFMRKQGSEDLSVILNKIGENLLPDSYKGKTHALQFLEEIDYNKIKLKEKDALLIDSQHNILQTPWDTKLTFEASIIEKSLEIIDDNEQFMLLKQEIAKLINEAEYVKSVLEGVKEIYADDLIERLSKDLLIPKINKYRLNLIKEFIQNRFSVDLTKKIKSKAEEYMGLYKPYGGRSQPRFG